MARKGLGLGEIGEVTLTPKRRVGGRLETVEPRRAQLWEARAYFKGYDGVRRDARVTARRRGEAEEGCRKRIAERMRGAHDSELRPSTPLPAAGDWYLEQIARSDSGLSARTVEDYGAAWRRYMLAEDSLIRGLSLEQVNDPQRLSTFLRGVADRHGTGASKIARSALSGLLRYAVEHGVLTTNALRQVRTVRSQTARDSERDHERALTRAERDALVEYAYGQVPAEGAANPRTVRKARSTADLVAFLAGVGCRIDEARSTRWEQVDLSTGTVWIAGTKSTTAARSINLPGWLVERLDARAADLGTDGFLFASPANLEPTTQWDQSNSARAVRAVLDGAGFPWAVPHTFRRTVATLLHESGAPIARIADQLGHADPSLTARVYLGRDFEGDKADLAAML